MTGRGPYGAQLQRPLADEALKIVAEGPTRKIRRRMKFVPGSPFADPEVAARKLVEIANAVESVQDDRIYIEWINGQFLEAGGSPRPMLSQRPRRRRRQCHPSAVGYNFRRILAWLRALLRLFLSAICAS